MDIIIQKVQYPSNFKLFSRNYEDLSSLKTIYDDLSLGSYKNIINNKAENYDFNIDFINQYTDEVILNLLIDHAQPIRPGVSLNYSLNDKITYKPTSKLDTFKVYFQSTNKNFNEENTYLEFEKWRDCYILNEFEISKKSDLFNFSELASYLVDKKGILLKAARELRADFIHAHRKIKSSLNSTGEISNLIHKHCDDTSLKMLEEIFQNAGLKFFYKFNCQQKE